jgi:predicted nucleotidyltransferase
MTQRATTEAATGLDPGARDRIARCLAHAVPPVIAAYLYGSAARHQTTPQSDIDIVTYLQS